MRDGKWIMFLGVVVLATLSSALTFWLMPGLCRRAEPGKGLSYEFQGWIQNLNLSGEQREKLKPLESELKSAIERLQPQLASARIEVCALLSQPAVEEKQLDASMSKVADLERDQQRQVVHHLFALKSILTPEQQHSLFSAIMMSICEDCRRASGSGKEMCGHCQRR